ncbi:putative F-box domain, leucine-rich repeat domain superfamily, F-box-like domain superfamily [Helianthus anomalus]
MELIHGTRKTSKFAPQDFISNMPDNVITNILDRLPLQDAVRTNVLSRNWRFKWTMLSQLVLDYDFFKYLLETEDISDHAKIISSIFLQLRGAITTCVLTINNVLDVEDINHWISFLSRNEIKNLTLGKVTSSSLYKLPTHLFSCLGLKHLKLLNCLIHLPTTFHGFPNLLSLELWQIQFEVGKFGEFITRCPVLENLKMGVFYDPKSKVKPDEIAKLANVKTLSLCLCIVENTTITSSTTIFELLGNLPQLQELDLDFRYRGVIEGGAKKRFPTAFACLRALKLSRIDLSNGAMLSCVFEIIRQLPNLQTLEIIATSVSNVVPTPAICSPEVDYNTMGPLQLRSVGFIDLKGSENEVCLITCLLGCSPFLKRIGIRPHKSLARDKQLMFDSKLLKLQRAYPVVAINLY